MQKEEIIKRRGKNEYERRLAKAREWNESHRVRVGELSRERSCKGGKRYEKKLKAEQTGLRGERNRIRNRDAQKYRPYKVIIAHESQIHHEWIPGTSDYNGVALVGKEQHQHGFVNVIQILEGNITLFTEQAIRER